MLQGAGRRLLAAPVVPLRPQVAGIIGKALRDKDYQRPVPFPYKKDTYGYFAALVDRTMPRFDENTKIIVVDGAIAAGKTKFAKELAEDLDMLYMPEANMDMCYINSYGYNLRQLDPQLPDSCKSFDEKDFLACPSHPNAPKFQFDMLRLRLGQYVDALNHILNTGQGVVMDRSVYSDFVFMETMVQFGYMSKEARTVYYESQARTLPELMRPHLVIYLDVPVEEIQRRVKARPAPYANSPFHSAEVLSYMEQVYKQQYLKQISNHAELLIYDWTESGDVEVVVEDIERLNFDDYGPHDPKMEDWRISKEMEWTQARIMYSRNKHRIVHWMTVPAYSVPELLIDASDYKIFKDVWWNAPGMKYAEGFNADQGDQFLALKTKAGH